MSENMLFCKYKGRIKNNNTYKNMNNDNVPEHLVEELNRRNDYPTEEQSDLGDEPFWESADENE